MQGERCIITNIGSSQLNYLEAVGCFKDSIGKNAGNSSIFAEPVGCAPSEKQGVVASRAQW